MSKQDELIAGMFQKKEEKNKYYVELECHFENPITEEDLANMMDEFVELTKKWGVWPPKARVIKNPTYDSFGNLWE